MGGSYLIGAIAFKLLETHATKGGGHLVYFVQLLSLLELVDSGYPSPIAFSSHLEWVENLFPSSNLHFLTTSEGKVFFFKAFFNLLLFHMDGQFIFLPNSFTFGMGEYAKGENTIFFFPLQTSKPAFLFITFREQSILLVLPSNTYKLNSFLCGCKICTLT